MAISTNQKPTIYRNMYENTGPGPVDWFTITNIKVELAVPVVRVDPDPRYFSVSSQCLWLSVSLSGIDLWLVTVV